MSYSKMIEILKEKNKNKILLIKTGVFYRAIGNDAVFLHEKIGLKCTCYKDNICKVGIPENSLEKYWIVNSFLYNFYKDTFKF